jgi:hypothetical protein
LEAGNTHLLVNMDLIYHKGLLVNAGVTQLYGMLGLIAGFAVASISLAVRILRRRRAV